MIIRVYYTSLVEALHRPLIGVLVKTEFLLMRLHCTGIGFGMNHKYFKISSEF